MAPDRRLSGREQLLRLLDEIERIPHRAVGPHLDEEDLIGLARGSLSADREEEVLEHVRSCAPCAEDAMNVPDILEAAAEEREPAAAAAAATAPAPVDPRAVGLVWMVAATAAWVARHQREGIVRLSGSPADSERRAAPPRFEWALDLDRRVLSVRTADSSWYDSRSDRDLGEAWVMLSREAEDGSVHGQAALTTDSRRWPRHNLRAEVKGYESFDLLPPESVTLMRVAFSSAYVTRAREAWQTWIDREFAEGRLTAEQVAAITGELP
jgi:hypothetical protein